MCANLLYFYIAKIAHRDQAVVLGYSYYKTIYKIDLKSWALYRGIIAR